MSRQRAGRPPQLQPPQAPQPHPQPHHQSHGHGGGGRHSAAAPTRQIHAIQQRPSSSTSGQGSTTSAGAGAAGMTPAATGGAAMVATGPPVAHVMSAPGAGPSSAAADRPDVLELRRVLKEQSDALIAAEKTGGEALFALDHPMRVSLRDVCLRLLWLQPQSAGVKSTPDQYLWHRVYYSAIHRYRQRLDKLLAETGGDEARRRQEIAMVQAKLTPMIEDSIAAFTALYNRVVEYAGLDGHRAPDPTMAPAFADVAKRVCTYMGDLCRYRDTTVTHRISYVESAALWYNRAIAIAPGYGNAWHQLSLLFRYTNGLKAVSFTTRAMSAAEPMTKAPETLELHLSFNERELATLAASLPVQQSSGVRPRVLARSPTIRDALEKFLHARILLVVQRLLTATALDTVPHLLHDIGRDYARLLKVQAPSGSNAHAALVIAIFFIERAKPQADQTEEVIARNQTVSTHAWLLLLELITQITRHLFTSLCPPRWRQRRRNQATAAAGGARGSKSGKSEGKGSDDDDSSDSDQDEDFEGDSSDSDAADDDMGEDPAAAAAAAAAAEADAAASGPRGPSQNALNAFLANVDASLPSGPVPPGAGDLLAPLGIFCDWSLTNADWLNGPVLETVAAGGKAPRRRRRNDKDKSKGAKATAAVDYSDIPALQIGARRRALDALALLANRLPEAMVRLQRNVGLPVNEAAAVPVPAGLQTDIAAVATEYRARTALPEEAELEGWTPLGALYAGAKQRVIPSAHDPSTLEASHRVRNAMVRVRKLQRLLAVSLQSPACALSQGKSGKLVVKRNRSVAAASRSDRRPQILLRPAVLSAAAPAFRSGSSSTVAQVPPAAAVAAVAVPDVSMAPVAAASVPPPPVPLTPPVGPMPFASFGQFVPVAPPAGMSLWGPSTFLPAAQVPLVPQLPPVTAAMPHSVPPPMLPPTLPPMLPPPAAPAADADVDMEHHAEHGFADFTFLDEAPAFAAAPPRHAPIGNESRSVGSASVQPFNMGMDIHMQQSGGASHWSTAFGSGWGGPTT